jgi:small subunit ribosomal protein S18
MKMQRPRQQQQQQQLKPKQCYFCTHGIRQIDYKELRIVQKFVSPYAKILPRRRTGTCSKHQRKLAVAVKRARFLALLPYVAK